MAKTIKFNLICDDKPIRTIEDLQENFSIEDILLYYRNGLLQRWLNVRGYSKQLEEVTKIESQNSLDIVKELIRIFDISTDQKIIEENVYMIEFLDYRKDLCSKYEKNDFKIRSIIDDYQEGYDHLVEEMLEAPDDIARIKANIEEIASNYKWALNLNHRELFWKMHENSALAIMCLLMNEKTRNYYLPILIEENNDILSDEEDEEDDEVEKGSNSLNTAVEKTIKATATIITQKEKTEVSPKTTPEDSKTKPKYDIYYDEDKNKMYEAICNLIEDDDFEESLGDNLFVFSGITDEYWKDLEPKGKKYMIISMGEGDFVRPAGLKDGDLSSDDVEGEFLIIDGIDYKSNSEERQLLYMEV